MIRLALPLALMSTACRPQPTTTGVPNGGVPEAEPSDRSPTVPPHDPGPAVPPSVAPPTDPTQPDASPPPQPEPIPASAAPDPPPEPCKKIERGKPVSGHEFIGETVAELDERGGAILCGRDPVWQLRFGTLCGDMASFHDVVTVEVRGGKVRRVWQRKQYNDAFCGGYDF